MKAKHVITTFAFAAAMALGVAGGLSRAKVENADAAGAKTLYCKMTQNWWTKDGAAVGVHYWGGANPTTWPGVRGTAVDGDPGVWKFEVPDNSTGLIFVRVNGSGDIADWGAKTADLTLPAGDNNLYTITSSSEVWGDPGVTGEWSHYDEPDPEEDHTYAYSINGGAAVELVENVGSEVKSPAKVTMAVGDTISFTKDGAAFAVAAKDDGQLTKVYSVEGGLKAAAAVDEVIYLDTSSAKLWAGQFPAGFYLLGVDDEWNAKLGLAAEKEAEGDAYLVENVALAAAAEIKMIETPAEGNVVAYYDADAAKVNTSSEVAFEVTEEYHNLKVTKAGTYDVYYNPETGWYSIEDVNYEPDVPAEEGYYICGLDDFKYATATKMENTEGDNVAEYLGLTVEVGDKIRVRSYYNDQEPKDRWANAGDDFETIDYGELDGNDFKFTKAGDYDIYAKYEEDVFKFYVAPHYVAPTYTVQVNDAVPEALTLNEGTEYMTDEITLEAGSTVKVLADGVEDTDFEFKHIGNNNYVEDTGKVLADADARVYVDISAKTIFVGGLDFGGYHLLVNGRTYHHMTHNESPLDPTFREYYSEAITFAENSTIRFIDTTGGELGTDYAKLFDITNVNKDSIGDFEDVEGVLTAKEGITTSVYLKLKMGFDEVYFGNVSEDLQAAINFAKAFNTAIEGVCIYDPSEEQITDEYKLAVKTAWGNQKTAFNALPLEQSRTILREATSLYAQEDIANFAAKYDSILALRGALYELEDFAGRAAASSGAVVSMNNNNAALIIVVSIIAGVSLVGLSTLLILKKKHK